MHSSLISTRTSFVPSSLDLIPPSGLSTAKSSDRKERQRERESWEIRGNEKEKEKKEMKRKGYLQDPDHCPLAFARPHHSCSCSFLRSPCHPPLPLPFPPYHSPRSPPHYSGSRLRSPLCPRALVSFGPEGSLGKERLFPLAAVRWTYDSDALNIE
jgi:hypothetical protein